MTSSKQIEEQSSFFQVLNKNIFKGTLKIRLFIDIANIKLVVSITNSDY